MMSMLEGSPDDEEVVQEEAPVDCDSVAVKGDHDASTGWADAMAKVLQSNKSMEKRGGQLLLAKAKRDRREIDGERADRRRDSAFAARMKKKERDSKSRSRPDVVRDKVRERRLAKIATQGVVQLFNAVREKQRDLKVQLGQAGKSFRKREKVFKNIDTEEFIDRLDRASAKASRRTHEAEPVSATVIKPEHQGVDDESTWKVFRDDFMMGAKMRDWDRESDEGE